MTDFATALDNLPDDEALALLAEPAERPQRALDLALAGAARRGRGEVAAALLKAGADPNSAADQGLGAMHHAAAAGNVSLLRLLLDAGADPNAPTAGTRRTALHLASANDRDDALYLLLEAGADPNACDSSWTTPLHEAVKRAGWQRRTDADLTAVELLLLAGADPDLPVRRDNRNPFPPASQPSPPPRILWRPFPFAVYRNHRALAELLLAHGADINLPGTHDREHGATALTDAARRASRDEDSQGLFAWLMSLRPDTSHPRLLSAIIRWNNLPVIRQLVEAGADPSAPNVLAEAVRTRDEALIRYLAGRGPGGAEHRAALQEALGQAIRAGSATLAELLLELGADPGHAWDEEGGRRTYADLARRSGARELADRFAELIFAGLEPAAPARQDFVAREFAERIRLEPGTGWQRWLDRGADPNQADETGQAPLVRLLLRHDLAGAAALLSRGADLELRDAWGRLPLHWAAESAEIDGVALLLGAGARPGAATPYGYTALHYAAQRGDEAMLRLLLDAGASPAAALGAGRLAGWTPLDFAISCEREAAVALLAPRARRIEPPEPGAHRLQGAYEIYRAVSPWHEDEPISAETWRCPHCGESALYNVAYGFDDMGKDADRLEIYRCANCGYRCWRNGMGRRDLPFQPWSTYP